MAEEMKMPDFLQRSFETIMEEMTEKMPGDIDMSEGNHPYNLLAPTAKQEEYFAGYIMAEALKRVFPRFCEGYSDFVDYHAEVNGITRKAAARAAAELTVSGKAETVIPQNTVFSTTSAADVPSVSFYSTEEVIIGSSGTARVPVLAAEAGITGNVAADTIILQDSPIEGIASVTNPLAASGGIGEETDASLIQRIAEYEETQGLSFVGNSGDYKRWAEEVDGTGTATVVPPVEGDDSGTVTIILTDNLGQPASDVLCAAVYEYIVSPDAPDKRKAPVNGAVLSVMPPEAVDVAVTAAVELEDEASLESVKTEFVKKAAAYMAVVPEDREIRYVKIGAVLAETKGIRDYDADSLTLNGGKENVAIAVSEFPRLTADNVTFTHREENI